jgi:hypothetical protein
MYYSSNEIIATALVKIVFGEREGTKYNRIIPYAIEKLRLFILKFERKRKK